MATKAPISRKQEAFLRAEDKRINLLSGSVRSGKTWISLMQWAIFVGSMPLNYEFIMCGKTVTALKRNCLNLLVELVGDNFKYSLSQKSGMLFGHRIWLEGANDERSEGKIRGLTLGGAYCDELTLFPQGFYMMLLSRLSLAGARLYATTNPDAPTHWVKTDIIDNEQIQEQFSNWHFTLDDNDFNDPEYVENLKREYSGVFYQRYILGLWVRAEGLIYPKFVDNAEAYMLDTAPEPNALMKINIGVDFGGNKSQSAFVATGFTRNYQRVILLEEECRPAAVESPASLEAGFVVFLKKIMHLYPGVNKNVFADSAEQILIRGLQAALRRENINIPINNAWKTQINDRIRLVNELLGQDRLRFMRQCKNAAEAFQSAVYDEKSDEDKRLDDLSYNMDIIDATEYSIEPEAGYLVR